MNISTLTKVATRGAHRGLLIGRKFAPEILTTVGVIGAVTATVMTAKATLKLEPIIDDLDRRKAIVEERHASNESTPELEREYLQNKTVIHVKAAKDIAKLYAPAATTMLVSLACVVGAHGIMRRRNVALVAAYKAVEHGFSEYRKRVAEEFGAEKDVEYRAGVSTKDVTDEETGKVETVDVIDPNAISRYARFFDEGNRNFVKHSEYNKMFLSNMQNYANDKLKIRGHIFLNEVYDMLGFDRTKEGSVVGWILNKDGDNYVDFGMYNMDSLAKRRFINGDERSILLDFNVYGVIFDKI